MNEPPLALSKEARRKEFLRLCSLMFDLLDLSNPLSDNLNPTIGQQPDDSFHAMARERLEKALSKGNGR